MKNIIIGGVAGGASCAARLRRLSEDCEIIVFEKGNYVSFANCGLPYYISDTIKNESALLLQTPESLKARFNIDVRVLSEVTFVDTTLKEVTVHNLATSDVYRESYDNLVLSPGAKPIIPSIKGIEGDNIFTVRSLSDTINIKSFINESKPKSAVVIGGGYIGVEIAENLILSGIKTTIVEISNHIIGSVDIAPYVHKYIKEEGVDLILNNAVKEIIHNAAGLTVLLNDGKLDCDMIIVATGVTPDTEFLNASAIKLTYRGFIRVNDFMETSVPCVYAAGDAVITKNFVTREPGYIPLAGPANKQGRIIANNICGIKSRYDGTQGSSIIKIFDMTVASTGINEQFASRFGYNYESVLLWTSSHAGYYPGARDMLIKILFESSTGKLLGAQAAGFGGVDKRMDILATAIRAGLTAFDLTELELCYAPPFSSAKDPVNIVGYMMENILTGKVRQCTYHDIRELLNSVSAVDCVLLDVRTEFEFSCGHIPGAVNIPVDSLRENLAGLDKAKPLYVNCQSGLRSYIACRILSQKGFTCYNLSGGYRYYSLMQEEEC